MNAITAAQLFQFKARVDDLIASKDMKKDDAIFNVLREVIIEIKDFLSKDAKKQKKKSSTQKTIKIELKQVVFFQCFKLLLETMTQFIMI